MLLSEEQIILKQVCLFLFHSDRSVKDVLLNLFPSSTRAVHQVEACLSVKGNVWLTEQL